MGKFLLPLLLVILSAGLFFLVTSPAYEDIKIYQARGAELNDALDRVKEIEVYRQELLAQYEKIPPADLERLQKLMPDNVDTVRLLIEINNIATQYGMTVNSIDIRSATPSSPEALALGPDAQPYGTMELGFAVKGNYSNFVAFVEQLSRSLRMSDITALTFSSEKETSYEYTFSIKTYWLH